MANHKCEEADFLRDVFMALVSELEQDGHEALIMVRLKCGSIRVVSSFADIRYPETVLKAATEGKTTGDLLN